MQSSQQPIHTGVKLPARDYVVATGLTCSLQSVGMHVRCEGHAPRRSCRQAAQMLNQRMNVEPGEGQIDQHQFDRIGRDCGQQQFDPRKSPQRGPGALPPPAV